MPSVDELILLDSFDHYDAAHAAMKACTYPGNAIVAGRTGNCLVNVQFLPYVKSFCLQPSVVLGVAFKSMLPGGSGQIVNLLNAATVANVSLSVIEDGRLLVNGVYSECPCITLGTWFYVEIYAKHTLHAGATSTFDIEVRVNGEVVMAPFQINDAPNLTEAGFTMAALGGYMTGGLLSYFDDLYITKTEFLGDIKIYVIRPDGEGHTNDWTSSNGGANYLEVDDVDPDDDASYIATATPNALSMVSLEPCIWPGVIKGIQSNVVAKKMEAGTGTLKIVNRFASTDVLQAKTRYPSYLSYRDFLFPMRVNPLTGQDFTAGEIDAMQLGGKEAHVIRITQIVVEWFNHFAAAVLRATQACVEVAIAPAAPDIYVSQACVEVLVQPPAPDVHVTQLCVEIAIGAAPPGGGGFAHLGKSFPTGRQSTDKGFGFFG